MLKNLLKKSVFTAVTAALLSTTASAQTIYWGAGHTDNTINSIGTFTGTAGSISSLGWTLNGNASVPQATWTYTTTGASNATITASFIANGTATTMSSPSIATGAVMFDSDSISTAIGDQDTPQGAHLISPSFDLSAAAGQFVTIKLFTNYFDFATDTFAVELSTDGGLTYTGGSILDAAGPQGVRAQYNDWAYVQIPTALSTDATTLTNCHVRVRYFGNYYFFAIDDISIISTASKDVAIAPAIDNGMLGGTFHTFRVGNSYHKPLSQVSGGSDQSEFIYGAKVVNKGTSALDATDDITLNVKIEFNDNGTWTLVHTDVTSILELAPGLDSLKIAEFTGNWAPTAVGQYRATYEVSLGNGADEIASNNTSSHIFNITENYYSKVPTNTLGYPAASTQIFPAAGATGNKVTEFEYGTMFFFPTGNYKIDSVHATTLVPTAAAANLNRTSNLSIKKFTDLDADGTISASPTSGELVIVGIASGDLTAAAGSVNYGSMTDIMDINTMGNVVLEANELYLVSFLLENPTGLYVNSQYNTYLPTAYEINYGLNAAYADAIPSPARIKIINSTGAEVSHDWNWIGFGADITPSLGLFISENTTTSVDVVENASNFSIFPNPASDLINVNLAFDAATTAQIIMTDVTGRVVRLHSQKDATAENVSFNVNDLSAGVYYISVKTEAGVSTQKFVKK